LQVGQAIVSRVLNRKSSKAMRFELGPFCVVKTHDCQGYSLCLSPIYFFDLFERLPINGERPTAVEGLASLGASEIPSNALSPGQSPLA
jgi:hypothetical protein